MTERAPTIAIAARPCERRSTRARSAQWRPTTTCTRYPLGGRTATQSTDSVAAPFRGPTSLSSLPRQRLSSANTDLFNTVVTLIHHGSARRESLADPIRAVGHRTLGREGGHVLLAPAADVGAVDVVGPNRTSTSGMSHHPPGPLAPAERVREAPRRSHRLPTDESGSAKEKRQSDRRPLPPVCPRAEQADPRRSPGAVRTRSRAI